MPHKRDNYFESVDEIMDVFSDKYVDDLKSFFIIGKFFGKSSQNFIYFILFFDKLQLKRRAETSSIFLLVIFWEKFLKYKRCRFC